MKTGFQITGLTDFKRNISREWVLTNGLGGYAGSSVLGAHNRLKQGYLVASLCPPVERYLVLAKTNEKLSCGARIFDLTTAQHKGNFGSEYAVGNMLLKSFSYDGAVTFKYDCGNIRLTKTMTLVHGKNQLAISYLVENNGPASKFTITPLLNYREHSQRQTVEGLKAELPLEIFNEVEGLKDGATGFYFSPMSNRDIAVSIVCSGGKLFGRRDIYDVDMELQTDIENDEEGLDCHFKPFEFVFDVPAGGLVKASLLCNVDSLENGTVKIADEMLAVDENTADELIAAQRARVLTLCENAGFGEDEFANALALAADQFVVKNESISSTAIMAGIPSFSDVGRETLISFTGLLLETKRFDEAKEILKAFAKYVKDGLVPNMFPSGKMAPLYNTVDASLWYFYDVYNYLKYADCEEAWSFVGKEIYPCLKDILAAYKKGTKYAIYMDEDGLLHAGDGLDQVTWMDVQVDDWASTPRHGKPVEINALWYNALMSMEEISRGVAKRATEGGKDYLADAASAYELATWVKESFVEKFWNEELGCLYDVVDGEIKDASIRPNQIFAVSLPFTMLDSVKEKKVVDIVKEKLYIGLGLRSLDVDDPLYHGTCAGSAKKREQAYHQGAAWSFLLGPFINAYVKVNGSTDQSKKEAIELLKPVEKHLYENCIGSICEIFDGDEPHTGRGCYAQAAGVGEVLRAYVALIK